MERKPKRVRTVTVRMTEDEEIDLMRLAARVDRSHSDMAYQLLLDAMYGMAHRVRRRTEDRNESMSD